jgi:hypothetical protein
MEIKEKSSEDSHQDNMEDNIKDSSDVDSVDMV